MKTIITIENEKITVEVDDGRAVKVDREGQARVIDSAVTLGREIEKHHHSTTEKPGKVVKTVKSVEKICEDCRDPFISSGPGWNKRKWCPECKARRSGGGKPPAGRVVTDDSELETPADQTASAPASEIPEPPMRSTAEQYCDWCKAWGDHTSENHPKEEKVARKNTKECVNCGDDMPATSMYDTCATCRDKAAPPKPEPKKRGRPSKHGPVVTKRARSTYREDTRTFDPRLAASQETSLVPAETPDENFTDPWNCARCREGSGLCRFHRSMEASGSKPPKTFNI